ncbi:MAG: efflux RND transporter periplasmic adaptor subunit [Alcaligenaceae bacterium]|nr:efflux RND transporter periplasmic adaptor subunit [Alcaligenaceae bacterium]
MFSKPNRYAAAFIAVALAAIGVAVFHMRAGMAQAAVPAPVSATAVEVATVHSRMMTDWHDYSGRLEAVERVDIRPLVSGTLTAVHFTDGSFVHKGDPLFTIDPRPYQAAADRARAQLAAARARAAYTASDLARGKRLLADNAIAKRDYEEKRNASREAAANLLAAKALLESAELDLGHTRIVAPISGRVSRAELTVGNVVTAGAGSAPLTSLVSMSRMYAAFDVDEQSFLKVVNPVRKVGVASIPIRMGLTGEHGYPHEGRLVSIDNRLDVSSGTIRMRAVFDNAGGALVPGLYARIRLGGGAPHPAVLIDERAVGTDQDKRFVVVVDQHDKTAYREVQLGAGEGGLRVVTSGLKAGERIVVNGLQRIRPGDPVTPQPVLASGNSDLALSESAAPAPAFADKS